MEEEVVMTLHNMPLLLLPAPPSIQEEVQIQEPSKVPKLVKKKNGDVGKIGCSKKNVEGTSTKEKLHGPTLRKRKETHEKETARKGKRARIEEPFEVDARDFTYEHLPSDFKVIDHPTLQALKIHKSVKKHLANIGWECLLDMPDYYVERLVLEFYNTVKFPSNLDMVGIFIEFELGETKYSMTLHQFNEALGFVSKEKGKQVVSKRPLCIDKQPNSWKAQDAFNILSGKRDTVYSSRFTSDFTLCDAGLRYLHRILVYATTSNRNQTNLLAAGDLFILWCMHRGDKINFGFWLGARMKAVIDKTKTLLGMQFVTKLAEYLGVEIWSEDKKVIASPLDVESLTKMKLVRAIGKNESGWIQPHKELPKFSAPANFAGDSTKSAGAAGNDAGPSRRGAKRSTTTTLPSSPTPREASLERELARIKKRLATMEENQERMERKMDKMMTYLRNRLDSDSDSDSHSA